jgi:plasmid maintenance system antidote protein VapI
MTEEHKPDYAVHPGELLLEVIESRKLELKNLFSCSSVQETYWRDVLDGKDTLDEETAQVLEDFTGVKSDIWLNTQKFYDQVSKTK